MFKIGDFSKVCQVSIKSLRHWDRIGLLQPTYIDPQTGYRYYHINQLEQVNRIQALRGMGLSLKETARLLEDDLSASEIRGMLRLKQAELRQQLEEGQAKLAQIETRLQQIEQRPAYEARLKVVEPQRVLALREITPDFQQLVNLIMAVYQARDYVSDPAESPVTGVFHDSGFDSANIDIQLGFNAPSGKRHVDLPDHRQLTVAELPGVELMACTVHRGPWIELPQGYMSLGRWIDDNGYQIVGPGREIFHHIGPNADASTVTELQFPVEKL